MHELYEEIIIHVQLKHETKLCISAKIVKQHKSVAFFLSHLKEAINLSLSKLLNSVVTGKPDPGQFPVSFLKSQPS